MPAQNSAPSLLLYPDCWDSFFSEVSSFALSGFTSDNIKQVRKQLLNTTWPQFLYNIGIRLDQREWRDLQNGLLGSEISSKDHQDACRIIIEESSIREREQINF